MADCKVVKGFSYGKLEKEEKALKGLFLELEKVVLSEEFDDHLQKKLSQIYPDFLEHLQKRQADLFIQDCAILVVGDTSSGKSTLINLLLDEDILETHLFACTTMIFKIISSESIYVKTYGAGKILLKEYKNIESRQELKHILQEIAKEDREKILDKGTSDGEDSSDEYTPSSDEDFNVTSAVTTENLHRKREEANLIDTNEGEVYHRTYIMESIRNTGDHSSDGVCKDESSSDASSTFEGNGSQRDHKMKPSAEHLDSCSSDFLDTQRQNISTSTKEADMLEEETLSDQVQKESLEEDEEAIRDDTDSGLKKDIANVELCREIEVYYPTPKLKGNVMIVDSPGFGEKEELTQRLREYLRNAVSFIFIIDINRAGGIHEEGIIKVLKEIREKQVDMFSFDPSDVIFVTNKWDAVPHRPGDKNYIKSLKRQTKRKIKDAWPSIKKDHICFLSAARVDKSKNDEYLKEYKALEKVILKVLEENENKRVKTHFRFLEDLIVHLNRIVMPRYGRVFLGEKDHKALVRSTCKKLEHLRKTCAEMQQEHTRRIQTHLSELAVKVYNYLQTDDFEKRILSEEDRKWSSYLKINIGKEVARRIEEETRRVIQKEAEDLMKNDVNRMLLEDYDKIRREIHGIDDKMSGLKEPYNIKRKIPITAMILTGNVSLGIALATVAIISLGPVGGILFAGGALAGLGFIAARFIKKVFSLEGPNDTVAYTAYVERMIGYDTCTIREMLDESFGNMYRNMSSHLFQHVFPEEIKGIELSVEDLESEYTILKSKKDALQKLKLNLDELRRKVNACYKLLFE